jgi:hypothetical protein
MTPLSTENHREFIEGCSWDAKHRGGESVFAPAPVLANVADLYLLRRHGALYSRPQALASAAEYYLKVTWMWW